MEVLQATHDPEALLDYDEIASSVGRQSVRTGGSRPKCGTAVEKRKLRNRLSQQAFRARQLLEITELKQRLA